MKTNATKKENKRDKRKRMEERNNGYNSRKKEDVRNM